MSHAEQAAKRKSRTKAVTVLAVAGALSLAAGASADGERGTRNYSRRGDVRVATFYVFDNENAGRHAPRLQLVKERRHRGGRSSAGSFYGGSAIYGGGAGYGGGGPTGAGGPDGM